MQHQKSKNRPASEVGQAEKINRRVGALWNVGIAAILVVAVILGFMLLRRIMSGNHPQVPPARAPMKSTPAVESTAALTATPAVESAVAEVEPMDWVGPLPGQVAQRFTEAKTHEERMELIADPKRDGWIMKRFFLEGAGANEKVKEVKPMGDISTDQQALVSFQVTMEDGQRRILAVKVSEAGAKVDFRCYARYGTESWEDLLSGRAKISEEVRVFLEPSTSYLRNYSDDKAWRSYIATSPDTEQILYFYAPRKSTITKQLRQLAAKRPVRVTLAIRSHGEDYQHRQFEITEILAVGWVK